MSDTRGESRSRRLLPFQVRADRSRLRPHVPLLFSARLYRRSSLGARPRRAARACKSDPPNELHNITRDASRCARGVEQLVEESSYRCAALACETRTSDLGSRLGAARS